MEWKLDCDYWFFQFCSYHCWKDWLCWYLFYSSKGIFFLSLIFSTLLIIYSRSHPMMDVQPLLMRWHCTKIALIPLLDGVIGVGVLSGLSIILLIRNGNFLTYIFPSFFPLSLFLSSFSFCL